MGTVYAVCMPNAFYAEVKSVQKLNLKRKYFLKVHMAISRNAGSILGLFVLNIIIMHFLLDPNMAQSFIFSPDLLSALDLRVKRVKITFIMHKIYKIAAYK